jgi:hypothetical protein
MGQRHQLYITFIVDGEVIYIGLHNQWLYGCIALEMLIGILSVISEHISKSNPEMCDLDAESAILDYTSRNRCCDLSCWSPLLGDNNNGITIIDARHASKPKYCFMAIFDYIECIDAHEEDFTRILVSSDDSEYGCLPLRGYPLNGSDFIDLHYHPEEGSEHFLKIAGLKEQLKGYASLSPDECFAIFPEIYQGVDLGAYSAFWKVLLL